MNTFTRISIGVIAIVIIVGGIYVSKNSAEDGMLDTKQTEPSAMKETNDTVMQGDEMKESEMMEENETHSLDAEVEVMMNGVYESYAPEKLARAEIGDVVISFHATWCPSCRALEADILKNINAIPSGVSILKVDYDTETELKKKYGVTVQNTLVQVDAEGNMIHKWSGSTQLETLVAKIK